MNIINKLEVKENESQTVWLFFSHHFSLGLASVLIYVCANVILLENNPQTSLPLAYIVSAIAQMLIGKVYSYYEHHFPINKLVGLVLTAVLILSILLFGLLFLPSNVAIAVSIMAGYRAIYLLTNLEFWATTALIFDIRQSKRLFSVISSGDMPAKSIGAILTAIIHGHVALYFLMGAAILFFFLSRLFLNKTLQIHELVSVKKSLRIHREPTAKIINQLFGGNHLIFLMCMGMGAVSTIAVSIEYEFFVNVKERFHDQATLMTYVGGFLSVTYLLSMLLKLFFTNKLVQRYGLVSFLRFLPVMVLLSMAFYFGASFSSHSDSFYLAYYCGLYLVFEIGRKAIFDPVFLLLFQPLPQHLRLAGHTLAKGFYEPMGMLVGGVFFYVFVNKFTIPHLPFIWMAMAAVASFIFFKLSYNSYLVELKDAFTRRFINTETIQFNRSNEKLLRQLLLNGNEDETKSAFFILKGNNKDFVIANLKQLFETKTDKIKLLVLEFVIEDKLIIDEFEYNGYNQKIKSKLIELYPNKHRLVEPNQRIDRIKGLMRLNDPEYKDLVLGMLNDKASQGEILALLEQDPKPGFEKNIIRNMLDSDDVSIIKKSLSTLASMRLDIEDVKSLMSTKPKKETKKALLKLFGQGDYDFNDLIFSDFTDREMLYMLSQKKVEDRLLKVLELGLKRSLRPMALGMLRKGDFKIDSTHLSSYYSDDLLAGALCLKGLTITSNPELESSLRFEIEGVVENLLYNLRHVYEQAIIEEVLFNLSHHVLDRRATAMEMLENLLPFDRFKVLQCLIDDELKPNERYNNIVKYGKLSIDSVDPWDYIVDNNTSKFSEWTVCMVIKNTKINASQIDNLKQSSSIFIKQLTANSMEQQGSDPFDKLLILKQTSLFDQVPENILTSVCKLLKEERYAQGEYVFKENDKGSSMFIIYEGKIEINHKDHVLANLKNGDFFGEFSLLDNEPRSANAVALQDSILLKIDQDDFYDLLEEREELMKNIIRKLSGIIRKNNLKLISE